MNAPTDGEDATMTITTIGIDLATHIFQLHCVEQHGKTVGNYEAISLFWGHYEKFCRSTQSIIEDFIFNMI